MMSLSADNFKLIVDESISNKQLRRFEAYAVKKGINFTNYLKIADTHSGMPDTQIIHHLLSKHTILVTSDRPLHNKVLSKGLRSFYVNDEQLTGKSLAGIKVKPDIPQTQKTQEIKASYHQPQTPIRSLLLPVSDKELKRLSTKRRRIRNHFGGLDNLEQIAVTVSLREINSGILIGVKIRVSSNVGIKALDASESYVFENSDRKNAGIVALDYALMFPILLMLNRIKTLIFFDADIISLPDIQDADIKHENEFHQLFFKLYESFEQIEFVPTHKGNLIDRLRVKLINLSKNKSNEIKPGNLAEILQKTRCC